VYDAVMNEKRGPSGTRARTGSSRVGKRGGRSFDLVDPVVVGGEDPDIVRDFLAARELAAACQAGTARPGDIAAALENLTEIHDYLVEDRRPL
jgi:hypothetical protein